MRIFVWEYVCSGAWPTDDFSTSLAAEGRAMLLAVAEDFARIGECQVVTCWDSRLGPFPNPRIEATIANSVSEETVLFLLLAASSDATLIIAPEFDGILLKRRRQLDELGCRVLGPTAEAIELCGDKLAVADFLDARGVPMVPTQTISRERPEIAFDQSTVIKPRYGAGSMNTFLIESCGDPREHAQCDFDSGEMIQQPFVSGQACSVAAIVEGDEIELMAVAEQIVSDDGCFRYCGGRVPFSLGSHHQESIDQSVRAIVSQIRGLSGYFGIDFVIPTNEDTPPLAVDINPRLTSSYLGYRQLAEENLAARMLHTSKPRRPIEWSTQSIEFRV